MDSHWCVLSALVHGDGASGEDSGHSRPGQDWARSGHPDAVLWHEGKQTFKVTIGGWEQAQATQCGGMDCRHLKEWAVFFHPPAPLLCL